MLSLQLISIVLFTSLAGARSLDSTQPLLVTVLYHGGKEKLVYLEGSDGMQDETEGPIGCSWTEKHLVVNMVLSSIIIMLMIPTAILATRQLIEHLRRSVHGSIRTRPLI